MSPADVLTRAHVLELLRPVSGDVYTAVVDNDAALRALVQELVSVCRQAMETLPDGVTRAALVRAVRRTEAATVW